MYRKHKSSYEVFMRKRQAENPSPTITKFFKPANNCELSAKRKVAISMCCSSHATPFNFYEDRWNKWATGISFSAHELKNEINLLQHEIEEKMYETLKGASGISAMDGWKNSVTGEKHVCFLLFKVAASSSPIYLKSIVEPNQSSISYASLIKEVCQELEERGIDVIGVVADNAPALQRAIESASAELDPLCEIRCGAHVCNLIIKKSFKKCPPLVKANEILIDSISKGIVSRYCETRWNSRFDRLKELLMKDIGLKEKIPAKLQLIY